MCALRSLALLSLTSHPPPSPSPSSSHADPIRPATRTVKNYTKGYSEAQTAVREATSNDSWGPSGAMMNAIAQMTFNQQEFVEVMEMLDKRLNDKGKNWRHVYKVGLLFGLLSAFISSIRL